MNKTMEELLDEFGRVNCEWGKFDHNNIEEFNIYYEKCKIARKKILQHIKDNYIAKEEVKELKLKSYNKGYNKCTEYFKKYVNLTQDKEDENSLKKVYNLTQDKE